jgi:hypothetical protein
LEMACRREEEEEEEEEEGVVGGCCCCWAAGVVGPVGRPNMASMVGRSAAPKGVERKSEGRSKGVKCLFLATGEAERDRKRKGAPLIQDGIDPPVRKPMQSFVKELQLKSTGGLGYHERTYATHLAR